MKVNLKMEIDKEKDSKFMKMGMYIKGIGLMITSMDKEY